MILSLAAMGLLVMSYQAAKPSQGASLTDDRGPGGKDR